MRVGDLKQRKRMKDVSESKLLGQEAIKQMLIEHSTHEALFENFTQDSNSLMFHMQTTKPDPVLQLRKSGQVTGNVYSAGEQLR